MGTQSCRSATKQDVIQRGGVKEDGAVVVVSRRLSTAEADGSTAGADVAMQGQRMGVPSRQHSSAEEASAQQRRLAPFQTPLHCTLR